MKKEAEITQSSLMKWVNTTAPKTQKKDTIETSEIDSKVIKKEEEKY